MNRVFRSLVMCATLVLSGYVSAGNEFTFTPGSVKVSESGLHSSDSLTITSLPGWLTETSSDSIEYRSIEQQYDVSTFSVSNNVRLSLSTAYAQATSTMKIGPFGLGVAFVSGDHSGIDYWSGPVYTGYSSAFGGAWLVDYEFTKKFRLALVHTYYDYFENGINIDSGSSTGFVVGYRF